MSAPELLEKFNTFFLVESEKSVESTAQFIAKRELGVAVFVDLKDLFAEITKINPAFVVVSVNFPHRKLTDLIQLLRTSFRTEVILFAEKQDRASLAQLSKIKDHEVFYGRLTGPSVVMKLRNLVLQRHLKEKRAHDSMMDQSSSRNEGQVISLHGNVPNPGDLEDFWNRGGPIKPDANTMISPASAKVDLSAPAVTEDRTSKQNGFTGEYGKGPLSAKGDSPKPPSARKRKPPKQRDVEKTALNLEELERMTQNFVLPPPESPSVSSMRVGLISVLSPDLEGYYALFEQVNSEVSDATLIQARIMIENEFKNSKEFKIEGCYLLYFDEMNPQTWIEEHAVFYNTVMLEQARFLLAFASHPKAIPELERKLKSMVAVDFNDVPVESTMSCEAYIFLPKNNKFIKYVAKGGELTSAQVDRLISMSIDPLYINENDVEAFKRSYVERNIYLVDAKERFKKKKEAS